MSIRVSFRETSRDNWSQRGMIACPADNIEYCRWLVNEEVPEDDKRRVVACSVKIKGQVSYIQTDADGLRAVLEAMQRRGD